jgi:hypothetical protein
MKNALSVSVILFCLGASSVATGQSSGLSVEPGPPLNYTRIFPPAWLLENGRVINAGGRELGFVSSSHAELYDPWLNTFTAFDMQAPRDNSGFVKINNGQYLIIGGGNNLGVPGLNSTEYYNPDGNTFTPGPGLSYARMWPTASQLTDGDVLITGAWYDTGAAAVGEILDPESGEIAVTGPLMVPRCSGFIFPTNDGDAILAGGFPIYGGAGFTQVERYDFETNQFSLVSEQLLGDEIGWIPMTPQVRPTSEYLHLGKYAFLAYRPVIEGTGTEFAVFQFDPQTATFERMTTDLPLVNEFTDGGYFDYTINHVQGYMYALGVKLNSNPQQIALTTIDLNTGQVYQPNESYTLPESQFLMPSITYIPSVQKMLLLGVSASGTDYFNATNLTYILTPSIVAGIEDQAYGSGFLIYPQPARDQVTISGLASVAGIREITLYDATGRAVQTIPAISRGTDSVMLDISSLTDGIYTYRIAQNGAHHSGKIVVTRH